MDSLPPPLAFVVLLCAGWVNRQQQAVIDYLLEENRVLRTAYGAFGNEFIAPQTTKIGTGPMT